MQAKKLPREKLENLVVWLVEETEKIIREKVGSVDFFEIDVDISDEWPYILKISVNIPSLSGRWDKKAVLDEILEEALQRFEQEARKEGLRPV